jgi:hypothetical protein
MFHDLVAELSGFRAELATAIQTADAEREQAVRSEITRLEALIAARMRQHHIEADRFQADGQAGLAAQARQRAAEYAAALPPEVAAPPAAENAAQSTPTQTAVTRRGTRKES